MDVEWATLSKTIEVGGFAALAEAHITASFFLDADNLGVYQWIRDHWSEFGATPGVEAFQHHYPAFALIDTPEPLGYYITELRGQRQYALVTSMLDNIRDPLKRGDTDIAIKVLHASLENLHQEVEVLQDEDLTKTTEARLDRYEELARNPGLILGLPTGFPTMDMATSGLQPEQLVTIVGLQKVGKSLILMCMNIACHAAGHRTLFASFEMSTAEQAMRHDALRARISFDRLKRGKSTPAEKTKLRRMMHGIEAQQPMTFVHDPAGTTTVSAIAAKIAQYRPEVVFIDGTYLMDAEIPNVEPNSAQALTSITRSLKRLAQRTQVPIVQSTQALTWKARKGLTLDSIGYSSSFAQDSDVIFGVEEVKDSEQELLLRIIAARNSPRKDVRLALDWDHGTVIETEEVKFGADDLDNGDR